jgi:3-hydroxyisobutyrate dehydrogenase
MLSYRSQPREVHTLKGSEQQAHIERVAVLGLGSMGSRIASRLTGVGRLALYDPVAERRHGVAASTGGQECDSPAAAADGSDLVIVVAVDARQVEDALFGPSGAAETMRPGAIAIVMSTIGPSAIRAIAKRLAEAGLSTLDAPMTGGTQLAERGELLIFAAGSSEDLKRAGPVLAALSREVAHVGEQPGDGQAVKLVNQLLCATHMVATAEALSLARTLGLELHPAFEQLRHGAGTSFIFETHAERMIDGPYADPRSALTILLKDAALVLEEARAHRLFSPLVSAAHQVLLLGAAQGFGDDDITGVIRLYTQFDPEEPQ